MTSQCGATLRLVPTRIQCRQHGGSFRVEAQRILTHTDDRRALYAFATCDVGGGPRHEFAEFIYWIDGPAS